MLDIADKHFITPQTVMRLEKGEPDYFDVIGAQGIEARKKAKIEEVPNTVPLKKDYKVNIQIESGLGYTEEGKKGRMMEIAKFVLEMAQAGYLSQSAAKIVVQRLIEVYKFGPTAELMEALEEGGGEQELTPEQLEQMKVAILETKKDLADHEKEQMKIAFLEVIKDLQGAKGEQEVEGKASREIQKTRTIEEGKEGRKTKEEVKTIVKEGD